MSFSASTYFAVWIAWIAVAIAIVPYLLLRPAPYGRHSRTGFGPAVNPRLAWVLMEAPSPLGMIVLYLQGRGRQDALSTVFLGLWLCHYGYRAFLFPFLLPKGARPMPVLVLASGAFFNAVNVYLNGAWLFFLAPARSSAWLASPEFVVGGLLFLGGYLVHVLADHELRRQRALAQGSYVIPRGRLFHYLSCPNYFGEIVEWFGFALATWSPGGLVFALWTAANLVPRAIHHHRWYRRQFPDYPRGRRAIFPFLL